MYVYMNIGMDYQNQQVPIHYRVCGQRLTKYGAKKSISYESKAFSAELKIAFDIDTSGMMSTFTLRCSACTVSSRCREPFVALQRECIQMCSDPI